MKTRLLWTLLTFVAAFSYRCCVLYRHLTIGRFWVQIRLLTLGRWFISILNLHESTLGECGERDSETLLFSQKGLKIERFSLMNTCKHGTFHARPQVGSVFVLCNNNMATETAYLKQTRRVKKVNRNAHVQAFPVYMEMLHSGAHVQGTGDTTTYSFPFPWCSCVNRASPMVTGKNHSTPSDPDWWLIYLSI